MRRNILLILLALIAILYCFRFGYIWTDYPHGGQFSGIPFALLLLLMAVFHVFIKKPIFKNSVFILSLFYFLGLLGFSITVELIRTNMQSYNDFLYISQGGWVSEILIAWLIASLIASFVIIRKRVSSVG